jgi:acyl-CoA reductase-like NAD-dependent aldehyde dehydrogenase
MTNTEVPYEALLSDDRRVPGAADRRALMNPATGQVLAHIAQAGVEDVDTAVAAAQRSFDDGPWRRASSAERARAAAVPWHPNKS